VILPVGRYGPFAGDVLRRLVMLVMAFDCPLAVDFGRAHPSYQ
jgi:hypothetical protein